MKMYTALFELHVGNINFHGASDVLLEPGKCPCQELNPQLFAHKSRMLSKGSKCKMGALTDNGANYAGAVSFILYV